MTTCLAFAGYKVMRFEQILLTALNFSIFSNEATGFCINLYFLFWAPRPTAVGLCAGSRCSVLLSREASRLYGAPALRAAATIPGAERNASH